MMYKLIITLIMLLFSFALVDTAQAATCYVDGSLPTNCTSGNYSIANRNCSGSDGNAYKKFQDGLNALEAGDTLYARTGTYNEQLRFSTSGTPGHWIEIRSYPGETAMIDGKGIGGPGNNQVLFRMTDVSYLKINHLHLTNIHGGGLVVENWADQSHVEITDNEISYGNWYDGYACANPADQGNVSGPTCSSGHAILVTTKGTTNPIPVMEHVLIDGNYVHDYLTGPRYAHECITVAFNVKYFRITNNTIRNFRNIGIDAIGKTDIRGGYAQYGYIAGNVVDVGNVFTYGENGQIYIDGASDVVIENNHVFISGSSAGGAGISANVEMNGASRRVIVRHNTVGRQGNTHLNHAGVDSDNVRFIHNSVWSDFVNGYSKGISVNPGGDIIFKNNIIQMPDHPYYAYQVSQVVSTTGNYTFDYNLYYGSLYWSYHGYNYRPWSEWQTTWGQDVNGLNQDPLYVDPANGDLSLQSSSPAIDKGGFLTFTTSSGSGTVVAVDDPYYFFDGYGIEGLSGDLIQIGSQTARVTAVNYANKTLTLDRSLSWSSGQGVSYPYSGSAPDIGAYEYAPSIIYGDVSGDGQISALDAALTARVAVGLDTLTEDQFKAADIDGNGDISAFDAALIAQYAVGLINKFPVEE